MIDQLICDDTEYGDIETPDSLCDILTELNEDAMEATTENSSSSNLSGRILVL